MAEYSFENQPTLLRNGDIIKFEFDNECLTYHCRGNHLHNTAGMNSAIWTKLGLDKYTAAIECYGYVSDSGSWPVCHRDDYDGLTRITLYLFEKISGRTGDQRGALHLNESMRACLRHTMNRFAQIPNPLTLETLQAPGPGDMLFLPEVLDFLQTSGVIRPVGNAFQAIDRDQIIYFNAKNMGEEIKFKIPLDAVLVLKVLRYLKAQPKSVPLDDFYAVFGKNDMPQFLQDCVDAEMLKYWSGGLYVNPESAKVKEILAAAEFAEAQEI